MHGRSRTGQVVHLIHFKPNGFGDVVADEFKIARAEQMLNISFSAGQQVVETNHILTTLHQPLAQRRTQKS